MLNLKITRQWFFVAILLFLSLPHLVSKNDSYDTALFWIILAILFATVQTLRLRDVGYSLRKSITYPFVPLLMSAILYLLMKASNPDDAFGLYFIGGWVILITFLVVFIKCFDSSNKKGVQ